MQNLYFTNAMCAFLISACILTSSAGAVTLPVLSTFDADTIGLPPVTGGENQPSSIFLQGDDGASLIVTSQSNGIDTQPIEASMTETTSTGFTDIAMAVYSFSTITNGILRIEETVSINEISFVTFSQTTTSTNALVTRLRANALGEISMSGTVIGTYEASIPFQVRMDIDLDNQLWSAIVDNELNGFNDDSVVTGNVFANDFSGGLPFEVQSAWFGLLRGVVPPSGDTFIVAHDSISIGAVPIPPAVWLFGSGLLGLIGISRHKKSA